MPLMTDAAPIAGLIAERLRRESAAFRAQWEGSMPVRHLVVDDLLPEPDVRELSRLMPDPELLVRKNTLRERKSVGITIDRYHPAVGAHLLAFQHPDVVAAVTAITGLAGSSPDPSLYASGISAMGPSDYLRPHLDNSHDGDQKLYRVLNLLFYVSPDWQLGNGGNLELWDGAVRDRVTIVSKFNRLVLMETNPSSWHSVSRVSAEATRLCLSNYYFSSQSPTGRNYHNVTFFLGRPEEPFVRLLLRADSTLLNVIGRAMPFLLRRNPHRLRED